MQLDNVYFFGLICKSLLQGGSYAGQKKAESMRLSPLNSLYVCLAVFLAALITTQAQQTGLEKGQTNYSTAAFPIVIEAARKGDVMAQIEAGRRYTEGDSKDKAEGVKWFRMAAEQGNTMAQTCLGTCYGEGVGVAKDVVEAAAWFRKAAEQGEARAQYSLGVCYSDGEGVAQDPQEAAKWCRKAAEQGHAMAQVSLGGFYHVGLGVPKDLGEAVKWIQKAAAQNDVMAELALGNFYCAGEGLPKSQVEGVKWYRRAAEQELPTAEYLLGRAYAFGEGVSTNFDEGLKWLYKAANHDYPPAQALVGAFLCKEPKTYVEAFKWFDLAAKKGHEFAAEERTKLEKRMTTDQIAQAQKLSLEFQKQIPAGSGRQ